MSERAEPWPVKLVVFNFDGTLSDSGEWFLTVIGELADRFRFRHVDRDELRGSFRIADDRLGELDTDFGDGSLQLPGIGGNA